MTDYQITDEAWMAKAAARRALTTGWSTVRHLADLNERKEAGGPYSLGQFKAWSKDDMGIVPGLPTDSDGVIDPKFTDPRCEVCGWRRAHTGHTGERCPDLDIYAGMYAEGMPIRQIAEHFELSYSYVRERLTMSGIDLRPRGRTRIGA